MYPRYMVIPVQDQPNRGNGIPVARPRAERFALEQAPPVDNAAQTLTIPKITGSAKNCMTQFYDTEEQAQQAAIAFAQENPKVIFGILTLGRLFETTPAPVIEKQIDDRGQLFPVGEHTQSAETQVTLATGAGQAIIGNWPEQPLDEDLREFAVAEEVQIRRG